MKSALRRSIFVAAGAVVVSLSAQSEPSPALDRASVWLGGFRTEFDGTIRLRNASGSLDTGEQPLLKGHEFVNRARVDFLLGDAQGFAVDYFRLRRDQTRRVDTSFTLGGTTYDPAAQLRADTRADFGNLSWRWWLGSGDVVFGAGLGAGYYKLAIDLDAQASANGSSVSGHEHWDDDAWAPLLSLGARIRVAEGVRVYGDLTGLRFHGGKNRTTLANATVGVEWFPWRSVGVGAEYATTKVHYRRDDTDGDQGRVNFDLQGPALYLRLRY